MIVLRLMPSKDGEPTVKGERVYDVFGPGAANYEPLGLKVRAKNIAHAEEKLLFCFRRELKGKMLDFDPARFQTSAGDGAAGSTPAQCGLGA